MNTNLLKKVTTKVSTVAGRTGLKIKKYSPEILLATGTVSIIGGVVVACKATLKVDDILAEAEENKKKIEDAKCFDEYSEDDAKRDTAIVTIRTGVNLVKNYIPSSVLIFGGLGCIYASYGIIRKRNIAITAAYTSLQTAFDNYRDRVKEEVGEEKEHDIRYGLKKTKVESLDENGKKSKKEVKVYPEEISEYSPHARFFDASSRSWKDDPEYNLCFLKAQQSFANHLLQSRGHVFLNEVYDMLGFDRTSAGQMVGWVLGNGDDYIDFGIYAHNGEAVRRFINGLEPNILLDFNIDGSIYEKI